MHLVIDFRHRRICAPFLSASNFWTVGVALFVFALATGIVAGIFVRRHEQAMLVEAERVLPGSLH